MTTERARPRLVRLDLSVNYYGLTNVVGTERDLGADNHYRRSGISVVSSATLEIEARL